MIRTTLSVLLAERGERQDEISKITGISKATLSNIANNKTAGIQYDNLEALAIYFDISVGELFDFSPYKFTPALYREPSSIPLPNFDEDKTPHDQLLDDDFYLFGSKIDILKPGYKRSSAKMYLYKYTNRNDNQSYIDVQVDGDFFEIMRNLPIAFKKEVQREIADFIETNFKETLNANKVSGRVSVMFGLTDEVFINV
ncbi:helix-turn-helix domain-containing protein [Weissella confusa]